MNKYLRTSLHAVYAFGLILIVSLSGSKYDWMANIDPTIDTAAIEDSSGNRAVFLGVVLAVAILAEAVVAFWTKKTSERLIAAGLVLVAVLAYAT